MSDQYQEHDDRRQRRLRSGIRVVSMAMAVVLGAAAVWMTVYPPNTTGEYDVIAGVRVSRALRVRTLPELRQRIYQPYVNETGADPTRECASYECLYSVDPLSPQDAFRYGATRCRPYYQWACATDRYHQVTSGAVG